MIKTLRSFSETDKLPPLILVCYDAMMHLQSCYDSYFQDIMHLFEQKRRSSDDDPAIKSTTCVGLRVLRYFVGLGFFFDDPDTGKLMARNKVVLDVFAMLTHTTNEVLVRSGAGAQESAGHR